MRRPPGDGINEDDHWIDRERDVWVRGWQKLGLLLLGGYGAYRLLTWLF